jgi:hypothetical protein
VRGAEDRVFQLFGDPDRADEEVDEALKKRGLISFNAMTSEEQDPAAYEERETNPPPCDAQKDDARDYDGDSDGVHQFVPWIGVLVIVLSHVLIQ